MNIHIPSQTLTINNFTSNTNTIWNFVDANVNTSITNNLVTANITSNTSNVVITVPSVNCSITTNTTSNSYTLNIASIGSLFTPISVKVPFVTWSLQQILPPLPGFTLAFNDDFTSFNGNPSGINGWMTTYANGMRTNAGNSELEAYVDTSVAPFINPFSVNNSILTITASLANVTGNNGLGLPYNSGFLCSANSFYQQYGYFEIKCLMPAGQGLWPAFWAMQEVFGGATIWPPEIDMFENLGNSMTTVYQNLHYSSGGAQQTGPAANTITDASLNWHVFAIDWEPTICQFYIDGQPSVSWATPVGFNVPMYIQTNLAVGGSWPGNPTSTAPFPANFQIDWIRAWASPNTTNSGGSLHL